MNKIKYLNLGCGKRYHKEWTNIDFVKTGDGVIAHNLLKGIPFEDEQFEVVYHSHVLEHFSKEDAIKFIKQCHRVLQPNGIIRIAVPDLEQIVRQYLKAMESALSGDEKSANNYDWMMLELYDQTIRNNGGGAMATYLNRNSIPNANFIHQRMGQEAITIQEHFSEKETKPQNSLKDKIKSIVKHFGSQLSVVKKYRIGNFRLQGEIHQWMYDRYSLARLLQECGFREVTVTTAFKSSIPNWNQYESLDLENGKVRKPDSLFMEARKK